MQSLDPKLHKGTGSWMLALLEALSKNREIRLAVACVYPGLPKQKLEVDGVSYFCMPQGQVRRLFHFVDRDDDPSLVDWCVQVIQEWQPDVIHIHGTERFYGLLTACKGVNVPSVVSIQGILTEYCKWRYTFGELSISDVIAMHNPLRVIRGIGPLWDYRQILITARRERKIVRINKYFMGRTEWDLAQLRALNPSARYYHVNEMLRPEFITLKQWDLNTCRRHSIIFTNARIPRKGVDILFKAVALLKIRFLDVSIKLAGVDGFIGEYGKYLRRVAEREGIYNNVEFLGDINAEKMVSALSSSHVFVLSSLIENSPNSLCEAQAVGLPCVATYTGGVPSLISDKETGFMIPIGDASMMADRIAKIFENDSLSVQMSTRARHIALTRHDPDTIVGRHLAVYRDVINLYNKN